MEKQKTELKKLGLILNPVAGMGGAVGLAGTDHLVLEALRRGAVPKAADRVRIALGQLLELRESITVLTYPGPMGGDLARSMGFHTMLLTPEAESPDSLSALPAHGISGNLNDAVSMPSGNPNDIISMQNPNDAVSTPSGNLSDAVSMASGNPNDIISMQNLNGAVSMPSGNLSDAISMSSGHSSDEILISSGNFNEKDVSKIHDQASTFSKSPVSPFSTTGRDTTALARQLLREQADLILFAGGDGTAIDVYQAVGLSVPVLGIPAGVKIHSPVYGKTPRDAGILAGLWLSEKVTKTREAEVLDIDEDLYRQNVISTRLFGYLQVPAEKTYVQNRKAPSPLSDAAAAESIAHEILRTMEPDVYYLIGAGTTTRAIMELLKLPYTLIGVDLICNRRLVASNVYGSNILEHIKNRRTKLIVTVTGGQGFLFGRGNQQLIPQVIRQVGKENISIIMTKSKLAELSGQPLLADTSDQALNRELGGYYRVVTGYGEYAMCRVCDG